MTKRRTSEVVVAALSVLATVLVSAQQPARDATGQQAPRGTASISGVVVLDGTPPGPARRARVTLNSIDRSVTGHTTTTDDAGAFVFRDLVASRYTIQAYKAAYLTATYGAKRPDGAGTPLQIKDGEPIANITLMMSRGAVVTGTVRDAKGNPVNGISISALKFGYSALTGERTLGAPSATSGISTDDRGMYRVFGLPPGDYLVLLRPPAGPGRGEPQDFRQLSSAEVQAALRLTNGGRVATPSGTQLIAPTPGPYINYAPVFFPGVTNIIAATTITLGLGETRENIDLPLVFMPTAHVSGAVTVPAEVPASSVNMTLVPSGANLELMAGAGLRGPTARLDNSGHYDFGGIAPGDYTVKASTNPSTSARSGGPAPAPTARPMWAMADITVAGNNLDVPLTLQAGMTIDGRIEFEGAPSVPPEVATAAMRFFLIPPGSGGNIGMVPGGQVNGEGAFAFTGVSPDKYAFSHSIGSLRGWTLKSAVANGRNAYDFPIDVRPNENIDFRVVFTQKPTTLTGTLQDASRRAATEYFIIVFPTDRSLWMPGARRVRAIRPASDGVFSAGGLPAGEYHVAALTDVDTGAWNDPVFLETLVPSSVKVTLRDGETTTQPFRIGG